MFHVLVVDYPLLVRCLSHWGGPLYFDKGYVEFGWDQAGTVLDTLSVRPCGRFAAYAIFTVKKNMVAGSSSCNRTGLGLREGKY